MVSQYPYQLQVLSIVENDQDENGNSLPPSEEWSNYCLCRDEANAAGRMVNAVDGTLIAYSTLIQMPKGTQAIAGGTNVRVMDGTEQRISGKVIVSRKDQLHSRAWV